MTDLELRKKASEIAAQLRDSTIPDEEIIRQIVVFRIVTFGSPDGVRSPRQARGLEAVEKVFSAACASFSNL
ncbi:hypothetical protein [uncultured Oscillibacter sp.]|uniref:hypothetical protein n=1 Tax=uncultured Oscillibacter sp. TaxID=876091 RepID=UPI0025D37438|nr:hypothetical protein [uncultured Oscillibacter sp.]